MIVWVLVDGRSRNILADWPDENEARAAVAGLLADGGAAALDGLALAAMGSDDDSGDSDPGPVYEGAALTACAHAKPKARPISET